jgi:hypothetical protein
VTAGGSGRRECVAAVRNPIGIAATTIAATIVRVRALVSSCWHRENRSTFFVRVDGRTYRLEVVKPR